ncbi:MAG: anaerobic ribonucleoside-triphosphate reductase [Bacteroidales bacterium]|jgi:ribonucleoside-triphosphate reductase|nr:anaerobic ribonucleoside-triphosphate reductase [Bacteroidales bacterium]MBQ1637256.1 anaerobic ribonucleoside-triphosphate reductase [Bacteroidales bacterium]MBQ2194244.1 anaerobic ribonucleoside-triphosphate reductase [Bacteroidales bacterium]MBQ4222113.1 anaerobic ribonucleoside-triphosphate reductase [Bacteroidales bacterium]MBQ5435133.1 anaerobic ribonucleoside-triphosphate reductase [Bacteroidales bacterium]
MEYTDLYIIKRDGKRAPFSLDKIKNAIRKAFLASGSFATEETLTNILSRVHISNGMHVEEIQNQVEVSLMSERYFAVAKAFMLYRQHHTEDREVRDRLNFLIDYCSASNPATGSKYDANANVEKKNIATLIGELPKASFIRLNRRLLTDRIREMFGKELSDRYLDLLNKHFIYKNDETSLANYCASITMYPWLLQGTLPLGGNSTPPTNLKSFCGGFVNLVFIVSSMLSGACATPEFLMYMNYFIEMEYGLDYYKRADEVVDLSSKKRTIDKMITDCFEQIVYSINQPTGARNFQSVFWNISYYDHFYFESIFGDFVFPDGSRPHWESLSWLQKRFMTWFNAERLKTILTFPVETMALLTKDGDARDPEYADWTAKMYSEGHSFFTYMSDNADSLASCCRLRNEIQDNGFSYTLGAGGVSTGSKSVLTINLNRCVQHAFKKGIPYMEFLEDVVELMHKVQLAYNANLADLQAKGMLPLFDAGFINLSRQYLTIGVNGLVEAAEFLGIRITDNPDYVAFVQGVLGMIERLNKKYRSKDVMFNCEMIPAENVGVKHAKWDREDGYIVPRDCYNSYFYIVEDENTNILDKFRLHGSKYIEHLTGGSALHMNLEEHLSQTQYRQLLRVAAREGCNYFTYNIPNTICNTCGHIDKRYLHECPKCGSHDIDYATRIIGYMKRVSSFSQPRQKEAARRFYYNGNRPDAVSLETAAEPVVQDA